MNHDLDFLFSREGPLSRQFPSYELRPSQVKMARKVQEALKEGHPIMVEAGTGTGKTFAYLIPALLSGKKTILSTGTRHLQDQVYFKDIPALKEIMPDSYRTVLMKGKENYLCKYRFQNFVNTPELFEPAESAYLNRIAAWAEKTERGDRAELEGVPEEASVWKEVSVTGSQCLGKSCSYYDACFITQMKRKVEEADLIIVNHHLFFADLALKETSFGRILPSYEAVIFDEAHLIEEIASEYFGRVLAPHHLLELISDARRELKAIQWTEKPVWENLDNLYKRSEKFFNLLAPLSLDERRFRLSPLLTDSLSLESIRTFLNELEWLHAAFLSFSGKTEGCHKVAERALQLKEDCEFFIRQNDPAYIYWGELQKVKSEIRNSVPDSEFRTPHLILHANPLQVSGYLHETLFLNKGAVILTSATLTVENRFEYMKDRIGMIPAGEYQFPSPFDYPSRALIYLPRKMPDPSDERFLACASEEIVEILKQTSGRAFILCTSHKNKEYFYRHCLDRVDYLLLKQGDAPKMELLKVFKQEISSVLFATQSFWQGVDVPGEALSCVIIDKLPFASPSDPVVESRIMDLRRRNQNPFTEYQVPSAVILLKQGLGRLIRSEQDRGVLSILDSRIRTKSYGKRFMASLPPCRITHQREAIKAFFDSVKECP